MGMFTDVVTYLLTSMLFTGLVLFPLAVMTLLRAISSALKFMMVHGGYLECHMIRHNNTIDTVMRAPKGKKILYKGKKFPFTDSSQYILRKGIMPIAYYDLVTGLQLPLKSIHRDLIDNEKIDTAITTSYDLGYKDGLDRVKKDENLQIMILIGLGLLLMATVYIAFNVTDISKAIPNIVNGLDSIYKSVKAIPTGPTVVS